MIIRNILSDLDKNDIYNLWVKHLNKVPDHQTIGAPSARQAEFLKEYLTKVKKILELKTGYKLSERFTIIREYKKGDFMKKHIDNAVSKTINIPNDYDFEKYGELLLKYAPQLKGTTVYRSGSRGNEPLTPLSGEEAQKYMETQDVIIGTAQSDCPSGICEISEPVIRNS